MGERAMNTIVQSTLCVLLIFGLPGCKPSLQGELDAYAAGTIESRGLVGVGISVRLKDGRLLQADAGLTDPSSTSAYSATGTRQVMGSVTKLYVATMIMQLVEEGRLSLDDTIEAWAAVPAADRITVRM